MTMTAALPDVSAIPVTVPGPGPAVAAPERAPQTRSEPHIEPQMAQVLELTQKNSSTVTPREINDHLGRILKSYDTLTAQYAHNSERIEGELGLLRQASSGLTQQLQQVNQALVRQDGATQHLAESTRTGIAAVQTTLEQALDSGLSGLQAHTDLQLNDVRQRAREDAARLDSRLGALQALFRTQEQIVAVQAQRLDQFDIAYALLDTSTRGNRARIETVREETERKHAVLAAQVQGLASLQREHYQAFEAVRDTVHQLQSQAAQFDAGLRSVNEKLQGETERLDTAVQAVASDLGQHALASRRTFQWTHAAIAAVAVVVVGGLAAVKWAPAFAPTSTQQALAQNTAALQGRVTRLEPLVQQVQATDGQLQQLVSSMDTLRAGLGEVQTAVGTLQRSVRGTESLALAASLRDLSVQDTSWALQQDRQSFTVQLTAVGNPQDLAAFVRQNAQALAGAPLSYTATQPPGGNTRYNLFYGVFASPEQARASIDTLPPALQAQKPWVRQWRAVQNAAR